MDMYVAIVISFLVLALVLYGFMMLAIVSAVSKSSSEMSDSVSSMSQNQSDLCSQMAFQICTPNDEQVELAEALMEQPERPAPKPRPMVIPDMTDDYPR